MHRQFMQTMKSFVRGAVLPRWIEMPELQSIMRIFNHAEIAMEKYSDKGKLPNGRLPDGAQPEEPGLLWMQAGVLEYHNRWQELVKKEAQDTYPVRAYRQLFEMVMAEQQVRQVLRG